MTMQEMFDTAALGLLTQNRKSLDHRSAVCKFRGNYGTKCAIGFLIPDSHYDHRMEGEAMKTIQWAVANGLFPSKPLAMALVDVHDGMPVEFWASGLESVAIRFGLDWSVVANFTKFKKTINEIAKPIPDMMQPAHILWPVDGDAGRLIDSGLIPATWAYNRPTSIMPRIMALTT